MDRKRIEEILRAYGRWLPEEDLFSEEEDRGLRATLKSAARMEQAASREVGQRLARSARPGAGRVARVGTRRLLVATVVTAAAAVLFLVVIPLAIRPAGSGSRERVARLLAQGNARLAAGSYEDAEVSFRGAVSALESASPESAALLARATTQLADSILAQGRAKTAENLYLQALDLWLREFPTAYLDVATVLVRLGDLAQQQGDLHRANEYFRKLGQLFEPLARSAPDQQFHRDTLAMSFERQADLARRIDERESPQEYYERFTQMYENRTDTDLPHPLYLRNLAAAYEKLGALTAKGGDTDSAARYYEKSVAVEQSRAQANPDDLEIARDLASGYERLARISWQKLDLDEARVQFDEALAVRRRIAESAPDDVRVQEELAAVLAAQGDLSLQARDGRASEHYEEFARIYLEIAGTDPGEPRYQEHLAIGYGKLADIARLGGNADGAAKYHGLILEIAERLASRSPDNPLYREILSVSHARLGDLARQRNDLARASKHYEKFTEIYDELSLEEPGNTRYLEHLAAGYARLGDLAHLSAKDGLALRYYRTALTADERLASQEPDNAIYQDMLAASYERTGGLCLDLGEADLAATYFERLLEMRQALVGPEHALTARAMSLLGSAGARGGLTARSDPLGMHAGGPDRRTLAEAEAMLLESLRIIELELERNHPWRRHALEALKQLYGPEGLNYPIKLSAIESKLRSFR